MRSRMMVAQLMLLSFIFTSCGSFYAKNDGGGTARIPAQSKEKSDEDGLLNVVKEIYVKGSIDGKSLFMVYGFGEATEDMKDAFDNTIKMEELVDLKQAFYDKKHKDDFVGAAKKGVKASKDIAHELPDLVETVGDSAKNIAKWPWKSIKRMKKSYEVSFEHARDSYYHTKNPALKTIKYAGHAIWANVKGAYYMVVEIPVVTATALGVTAVQGAVVVGGAAAVALAVPGSFILQTLKVTWRASKIAFRVAMIPLRVGLAGVEGAYAFLSTTTATVVTLAAAGGLGIFKGTKFLVYTLPHRLFSPVSVSTQTQVGVDDQDDYAKKVENELQVSVFSNELKLKTSSIKEYKSKFELASSKVENAVDVFLAVDNQQKVKVSIEATKAFVKSLKVEGETRHQLEDRVEKILHTIMDQITKAKV